MAAKDVHAARRRSLREPFNGLSHLIGAVLFLAGMVVLLVLSDGDKGRILSYLVYGLCAIGVFLASGLYHSLHRWQNTLERVDHSSIYLMIAGSYTPMCVLVLPKPIGWWVLAVQWVLAGIGVSFQFTARRGPAWARVTLYLIMGWMAAGFFGHLSAALSSVSIALLVAGGVLYTVGTVIYATNWPRLWPGKFSAHELWHCMVLAAAGCHFVMMLDIARTV